MSGRETAEERAERRVVELLAEVDSLQAERDELSKELELARGLIDGEPWAGAIVKRERDKAYEVLRDLAHRCKYNCTRKSCCSTCELIFAVLPDVFTS